MAADRLESAGKRPAPHTCVPQNTIKFGVGLAALDVRHVLGDRGAWRVREHRESLAWPGGDVAILVLLGVWSVFSWSAVRVLRRSDEADRDEAAVALRAKGG